MFDKLKGMTEIVIRNAVLRGQARGLGLTPDELNDATEAALTLVTVGAGVADIRQLAMLWASGSIDPQLGTRHRDLDVLTERVEDVHYRVESMHQMHGTQCVCGFESLVSRYRTQHIVTETLIEAGLEKRATDG
ncbi:hypothetical protein [Brevibacterium sp.]|uniref:hypothetical protein n=1 Tax=Brevibacterium sp. TaxID=1701 RepID=UPI00281242BC|nr:hypothetical protein [Brevibacterium sp.]